MLKIEKTIVVLLSLSFVNIVVKIIKHDNTSKTDSNVRIIVISDGTWLTSPPIISEEELRVTILGGNKSVFVEVSMFPSSPFKIHQGEKSARARCGSSVARAPERRAVSKPGRHNAHQ